MIAEILELTPPHTSENNCGSSAVKSSLDLGLTELLLWWKEYFNDCSQTGWVIKVEVFFRVLFWRMETSVLCSLNFAIPLGGGQTWEVKPNTLYQKAWIYMTAAERGWSEMFTVRHLKAGRAPSEGHPQKSGACWCWAQWSRCQVGMQGRCLRVWSSGLLSSEAFRKSGLGRTGCW